MKLINLRFLIIGIAMLVAAGLAFALTPREKISDQGPKIDLETMIPRQFGDWKVDESVMPLQISPDQAAMLNELYSQTMSRTFVNHRNERVMLSIAYGGNQSRHLQVHRPEVCYSAQGFEIGEMVKGSIQVGNVSLPVMRLVALQGQRNEPITYWVRFGGTIVRGNLEQGFARLKYGLTGKVVDGMLVRVSSISKQSESSFKLQDQFVKDMLAAVSAHDRNFMTGM